MFRTKTVVYLSIDPFLSSRGKFLYGYESFQAELDEREIPCIWLSSQSRLQLDDPRRRVGHTEPFIAEDGCAVYLPEDYFHLKPSKTVRLGRFTCIPIAQRLPAAEDALESLSEESGVPVVPLRTLSPRELSQNIGLPNHEAEVVRQRDFDELFFFAGAADVDIARFRGLAANKNLSLREHGVFWSLAVGADFRHCIREIGELFDRSLHGHANRFAITTLADSDSISQACDRRIRLVTSAKDLSGEAPHTSRFAEYAITTPGLWESVLAAVDSRP